MDTIFKFVIISSVALILPQKSYSLGFETISDPVFSSEKSDPSKQSNSNHDEDHSTPLPEIPDLQHYMTALNQQSVLSVFDNLPVATKKNMINVLGKIISICGRGHPASMILSHIQWLIRNSQEAQHSFDRKESEEDEQEDNELQVRALGFDFNPTMVEKTEILEKPEQKIPFLTKSSSRNNLSRPNAVRNSVSKKFGDVNARTMSV